jgi:hypothetical protein
VARSRCRLPTNDYRRRTPLSSEWNSCSAACSASGVHGLPVTLEKILACWHYRVIEKKLKSSALQSVTSRILTHAALLGHPTPPATVEAINAERVRFCNTFPCEVRALAPALSSLNGLDTAIAFAEARTGASLFFRSMYAALQLSKVLYCRPTALLSGRLRKCHCMYLPPSATSQGGLVLNLLMPKRRKDRTDRRLDSHPIPTGPAVLALVSLLDSLGLLRRDAPADGIAFPDIDPLTDAIRAPRMPVKRSTEVLRSHVFIPAGIPNGGAFTLRGIRSGSSTDATISGVSDQDRNAQGGWKSAAGSRTYLDRALAMLSQPGPSSPR